MILALALAVLIWPARIITFAQHEQHNQTANAGVLVQSHNLDFLFELSYSQKEQPYGPLVVYRAINGDLRDVVPVVAVRRSPALQTPLLFPSPDGRYVALLQPLMTGFASNLDGATLSIFSTSGQPLAPPAECQTSQKSIACHAERSEESPAGLRFFAALRMTGGRRFFAALRMTGGGRFFAALRMTGGGRFFAALR